MPGKNYRPLAGKLLNNYILSSLLSCPEISIQVTKPVVHTTVEEWDAVMASNLQSVFLSAKLAHPLFKNAGGGVIVNISLVNAIATSANIARYADSKGGLLALTRAMAIEFAPENIRVNAVLPGAVDTPMLHAGLSRGHTGGGTLHERLENLAHKTVIGRVGKPEEIAQAIYFLADEAQSSFMTGQAMIVDGGATARLSTERFTHPEFFFLHAPVSM